MEYKSLESTRRSSIPANPPVPPETLIEPEYTEPEYTEPEYEDIAPPKRRRIPKRWLGLLCLFLIAGGYWAFQRSASAPPAGPRPTIAKVERKDLSVTVSSNGTVEPEQLVNVSPKTTGIMTKLLVEEGDRVSQGQIIAYMDDSNLRGQFTQAQGQLAKARADLAKMEAGNRVEEIGQAQARLESAKADLGLAESDLKRNQGLYESGAIARQTYDQARTVRDTAQAKLMEVQQALSLSQAGSRTEDIAAARAQVISAEGSLQTIQAQVNDTIVRAPFSGVVSRKYADPGAFVAPTTAGSSVSSATSSSILSLASANRVVANVAESRISQIKLGQSVTITADAFPGKTFEGRVSQIATQAIVEQNVTSFEVKVALVGAAAKELRSGMNVSAQFNVGQLQDVLTVPTVAVTRKDKATGVYVGAPGQPPRFIPITTGITVDNRTEVKSGLDGTEHILINVPTKPPSRGFSFSDLFGGSKEGPPGGGPPGGGPPGGGPPGGGGRPSGPPPG